MPGTGGRTGIANIGYEGRTIAELIEALRADGVARVVDIRADPVSRRPGFSGARLARSIEGAGLEYIQMRELGVPRDVRRLKDAAGKEPLLEWYHRHLDEHPGLVEQVAGMAKGQRIALLCYERDESECHRGVLSERLRAMGMRVDAL